MIEQAKDLLSAVPIAAMVIDAELHIRGANAEAQRLLGTGLEGRHFRLVLRQPAFGRLVETVRTEGQPQSDVMAMLSADRRSLRVRAQVAPVGELLVVTLLDIGDADEASRIKRDFVTDVSHELKTPLTAILGLVETLNGSARDDPAGRDAFLDALRGEASRMHDLVGDLLSLSRVEAETYRRPVDTVDLVPIIEASVESARPLASQNGIEINPTGIDGAAEIIGDATQIRQVIDNILRNAILHGGEGASVAVRLTGIQRDPILRLPAFAIVVEDSGVGFDPVHIPRLTERFYRIDTHRARDGQRGTGLGLSIVKHIMTRHRGRLKIESAKGQGTVVTVIFPQAA